MVFHDVGAIRCATEDVYFGECTAARGGVRVIMVDFESVYDGGEFVTDFVNGAAVAMTENGEFFKVTGTNIVTTGNGGGGG